MRPSALRPRCVSYEFATKEVIEGTSTELRVKTLRMLTEEEIRMELEGEIATLGEPVQVVFANQRCQDCGQVNLFER